MDALIKWAVIGALAAAAIAAAIGAWEKFVGEPYRKQGDVRTAQRDAPVMSLCESYPDKAPPQCAEQIKAGLRAGEQAIAANKSLRVQVDQLGRDVQMFAAEAQRQQDRAAKARADAKADNEVWADIVAAMDKIIHRPASAEPCEGICARARDVLRGLADDSVRQQPATP